MDWGIFWFGLNCVCTGVALTINALAFYDGYWNLMIGQSLIICPLMTFICYFNL